MLSWNYELGEKRIHISITLNSRKTKELAVQSSIFRLFLLNGVFQQQKMVYIVDGEGLRIWRVAASKLKKR
jgi:hypothetical protein